MKMMNRRNISLLMAGVAGLLGMLTQIRVMAASENSDLASYVNPFVGTDNSGDTFPGACAPFGMIQLSPNWDNNGYYYPETKMHGFVLNLLNGDGGANEGEGLFTATTGPVKIDRDNTDYNFDHQHESASAGYYQVMTQPWGINAELTALTRTGMARFTFPAGKQANIILPIGYANKRVYSAHVHVIDSQTVGADVTFQPFYGDAPGIKVYYVMQFSKPFSSHGTWGGTNINAGSNAAMQYAENAPQVGFYGSYAPTSSPQSVEIRIAESYVSEQGALNNLSKEIPKGTTFNQCRALSQALWNKELSLIEVQGGTKTHNRVFYTALYHVLLSPRIADDVDGRYFGYDNKVHTIPAGHTHFYETFSGWDIYRSEIPLLSIIEPDRTQDIAESIVEMYNQLGYIDRWPEDNDPCYVMNGNPLTVCLVNIWNSGLHNFDINTAYEAMWKESQFGSPHNHIDVYQGGDEEKNGVTLDSDTSVSSAEEYDESFAALGHLAEELGKDDDANFLYGRAFQYRDLYNPGSGYMQRRLANGQWDQSFSGYTEGDKWIYLWFVPEDVQGLVDLIEGAQKFDSRLDEFFTDSHYDPTNEPDLQAPFLYDYINRGWKTQHLVAETADKCFTDEPGGLANGGNDDLGTMSAWYVLSQLGFYFVDPGMPYVEVCSPRFPKAIIHLSTPHGSKAATFEIDAPNAGAASEYIQSATLNNQALTKTWFPESQITDGGVWNAALGDQPNEGWASDPNDRPYSLSSGWIHRPANPVSTALVPDSRLEATTWKYLTSPAPAGWFQPSFDDSSWQSGPGGFGTEDVGVTPRTVWNTDDIYLRRVFTVTANDKLLQVNIYHDQDCDIYINGLSVGHIDGWTHSYDPVQLPETVLNSLHVGQNILAVHVRHPGDGRHYADAGLVSLSWPDSEK